MFSKGNLIFLCTKAKILQYGNVLGASTRLCDCLPSMLRLLRYFWYEIPTCKNTECTHLSLPMVWPSIVISVTVLVRQLIAKRLSPLEPMQTPVADRPSRPSFVMWSMKSRLGVSILILELPGIRNGQFHEVSAHMKY